MYIQAFTLNTNISIAIHFYKGVNNMKVWVCDECGREVSLGVKPDKCECGATDSFIQIERADESGFGCKGPSA